MCSAALRVCCFGADTWFKVYEESTCRRFLRSTRKICVSTNLHVSIFFGRHAFSPFEAYCVSFPFARAQIIVTQSTCHIYNPSSACRPRKLLTRKLIFRAHLRAIAKICWHAKSKNPSTYVPWVPLFLYSSLRDSCGESLPLSWTALSKMKTEGTILPHNKKVKFLCLMCLICALLRFIALYQLPIRACSQANYHLVPRFLDYLQTRMINYNLLHFLLSNCSHLTQKGFRRHTINAIESLYFLLFNSYLQTTWNYSSSATGWWNDLFLMVFINIFVNLLFVLSVFCIFPYSNSTATVL